MIGQQVNMPGLSLYEVHPVPIHLGGPAYVSALDRYLNNVVGYVGGVGGVVCLNMFRPIEAAGAMINNELVLGSYANTGTFAGTIYNAPLIDNVTEF